MPSIDVNHPFDLFGAFWKSEDDQRRVPGRLYRDVDGIRIQLFEDLRPGSTYVPRHQEGDAPVFEVVASPDVDEPLTLHGKIGQMVGKITAYECVTVRSTSDLFDSGVGEYVLAPRGVVFGAHTIGVRQKFVGVRVRTRDMDEWAGLPGFSIARSDDGERSLRYRAPSIEPVSLANGGTLSINQAGRATWPTVCGGSITREFWIEISQLPPSSWSEIDAMGVTPLCSLIALCLGEINGPVGIQLTIDGENWVELSSHYIQHAKPSQGIERLADLQSLQLLGVAKWLDQTERLGPLPPVVSHFASRKSTVKLETELLEMTTVAEGLHARLFPRDVRFDDKTCETIRDRVLGAVGDMEQQIKDVLRGMLAHLGDPSYPKRLRKLAEAVEPVAPGICGKINKWAEEVSQARNKYAHRSAGFLDEGDIDTLATVLESLKWVLRCVLLLEAGVNPDLLAARLQDVSSYRVFLGRAAEDLPAVYKED